MIRACVVAVAVLLLGGGCRDARSRSSPEPTLPTSGTNQPDVLFITVEMVDGSTRTASMSCTGRIWGTGYLEDPGASASACITANISGPVNNYLAGVPRHSCAYYIAVWQQAHLPDAPLGKATITGIFTGIRNIHRHIDATKSQCNLALWTIMQPLFTPSRNPLILNAKPHSG